MLFRSRLNESLEDLRDIRIRTLRGRPANCMLCAMRDDGEGRNVLIVRGQPAKHGTPDKMETYFISLTGRWKVELWDTLTGEIRLLKTEYGENRTDFTWNCFGQDSLLLRLEAAGNREQAAGTQEIKALYGDMGIHMAEV